MPCKCSVLDATWFLTDVSSVFTFLSFQWTKCSKSSESSVWHYVPRTDCGLSRRIHSPVHHVVFWWTYLFSWCSRFHYGTLFNSRYREKSFLSPRLLPWSCSMHWSVDGPIIGLGSFHQSGHHHHSFVLDQFHFCLFLPQHFLRWPQTDTLPRWHFDVILITPLSHVSGQHFPGFQNSHGSVTLHWPVPLLWVHLLRHSSHHWKASNGRWRLHFTRRSPFHRLHRRFQETRYHPHSTRTREWPQEETLNLSSREVNYAFAASLIFSRNSRRNPHFYSLQLIPSWKLEPNKVT